ncbi:hypothetical protein ACFQQB_64910 [Nonomuraea rubra]|uniref:hypothetical protein n=1 Tax=Nonomuraea rubra TaxID=46180 RepID=UPI003609FE9D
MLIDEYAQHLKKKKLLLYHPPLHEDDVYITTLVNDVKRLLPEHGIAVTPVVLQADSGVTPALCDKDRRDEMVFYAGREEVFGEFLTNIAGCEGPYSLPRSWRRTRCHVSSPRARIVVRKASRACRSPT